MLRWYGVSVALSLDQSCEGFRGRDVGQAAGDESMVGYVWDADIPSAAILGRRAAESRDIAPESTTLAAEGIAWWGG